MQLIGIARADFLERVRRHAFLVTLGLTVVAGYLFLPPNHAPYATLRFGIHRGVYNSAWVGTVTAMLTATFLSLAGFYLVKNAVEGDRRTGVGAILAATPITRRGYVLGKTLSNFCLLSTIVVVVVLAAAAMQILRGEDPRLDPLRLLAPFVVITLPAMVAVAATAVLFEVVPVLRGGLGNVAYFILWNVVLASSAGRREPGGFDLAGLGHLLPAMALACHRAFPNFDPASGQMGFGFNFRTEGVWDLKTFAWGGMEWTGDFLAARIAWFGVALVLIALAATWFDRFDEALAIPKQRSRGKSRRWFVPALSPQPDPAESAAGPVPAPRVARLAGLEQPLSFLLSRLVVAELALMKKDVTRGWSVVAAGLLIASVLAPMGAVRNFVLPALWIWPLLIWSALGNRENRHATAAMLFSTPRPRVRPLMAQWLAGAILAFALASGVAARLIAQGDAAGLFAILAGALFIPALAVALGAWSGSGKLFEILYLLLWYVGPVNRAGFFDFTGLSAPTASSPWVWLAAGIVFLILAISARSRSIA